MFNKILLASDGSADSAKTVALARHYAIQDGADIEVVHVREFVMGRRSAMERAHDRSAEQEATVREQVAELVAAGVHTELLFASATADNLAAALAERADASGADVLIVGADLHPGFGATSGRSITRQLVQFAPCPVMVVPMRAATRFASEPARTAAASSDRSRR